jgi:hypothetical protein
MRLKSSGALFAICFILVPCLSYPLALKMEMARGSTFNGLNGATTSLQLEWEPQTLHNTFFLEITDVKFTEAFYGNMFAICLNTFQIPWSRHSVFNEIKPEGNPVILCLPHYKSLPLKLQILRRYPASNKTKN